MGREDIASTNVSVNRNRAETREGSLSADDNKHVSRTPCSGRYTEVADGVVKIVAKAFIGKLDNVFYLNSAYKECCF